MVTFILLWSVFLGLHFYLFIFFLNTHTQKSDGKCNPTLKKENPYAYPKLELDELYWNHNMNVENKLQSLHGRKVMSFGLTENLYQVLENYCPAHSWICFHIYQIKNLSKLGLFLHLVGLHFPPHFDFGYSKKRQVAVSITLYITTNILCGLNLPKH